MQQAKWLKIFCRDLNGSIAVVSALVVTAAVMATGMAVDYVMLLRYQTKLQAAADAAAIAGAREISLASTDQVHIQTVAANYAKTNLGMTLNKTEFDQTDKGPTGDLASNSMSMSSDVTQGINGSSGGSGGASPGNSAQVTALLDEKENAVTVKIEGKWNPHFAGLFSNYLSKVAVSARAQRIGAEKICVLALEETQPRAIFLSDSAKLTANDCGVYSNSTNTSGVEAYNYAVITAPVICSAGGTRGGKSNFSPSSSADCPQIPDPMADRDPPPVGMCDHTNLQITAGDVKLQPGSYCGGLLITDGAVGTMAPGVYIIKDGAATCYKACLNDRGACRILLHRQRINVLVCRYSFCGTDSTCGWTHGWPVVF